MADLLNRNLDVIEQINSLKTTDALYGILIGSVNSKLIEHDQQFLSELALINSNSFDIRGLSATVDRNYTSFNLLLSQNFTTLSTTINTVNSILNISMNNILLTKQDNIIEANYNTILKNNRIKSLQSNGIISVTNVDGQNTLIIDADMSAYQTSAQTKALLDTKLADYAKNDFVNSAFQGLPTNYPTLPFLNTNYVNKTDLTNYFTKDQMGVLYYQKADVYNKTESDSRYQGKLDNSLIKISSQDTNIFGIPQDTSMAITPNLIKFYKRIITPTYEEVTPNFTVIQSTLQLPSLEVSNTSLSLNLMRVNHSSVDSIFPIYFEPKFKLTESNLNLTVPILNNPTINTINGNINTINLNLDQMRSTINSILVTTSTDINDQIFLTETPNYLAIKFFKLYGNPNDRRIGINLTDNFTSQYQNNLSTVTNLNTTTNSIISSLSALSNTTTSIINNNVNLSNRTSVLESLITGSQGNAITDLYSTTNSVLVLNNKTFIANKFQTNTLQGANSGTITIASNLNLSSPTILAPSSYNFNVKYNQNTGDDVMIINSLGDPNNNNASLTIDKQIFQLKRDYLRLPIPINECPTISYLQNYTIYNTNTQNSIINTLTNLQSTINGLQSGTANNNDVIALQNTTNSLITNVSTNANNISSIQAQVNTNVNNISSLFGNVNTNNTDIIGLKNTTNSLIALRITTNSLITTTNILQTTTNSIITNLNSIQTQVNTNVNNISSLFGNVNTNNTDIIGLKNTSTTLFLNTNILQTTQASILNSISSLNSLQGNYIQSLNGSAGYITTLVGGTPLAGTIALNAGFQSNLINTITTASILSTTTNSIISNMAIYSTSTNSIISTLNTVQAQTNTNVNNIASLTGNINSINTTLSTYTFSPKIAGKVYGSGSKGQIYGESVTVTVESTGQYLLSWSTYQMPVNAILIATLNLSPSAASITSNIIYVSATSARVNTYSSTSSFALPFSFIIY